MANACLRASGCQRAWAVTFAACSLALLVVEPTQAHGVGLSSGTYVDRLDGEVMADLDIARTDLLLLAPGVDIDSDGRIDDHELALGAAPLAAAVAAGIAISLRGTECASAPAAVEPRGADGALIRVRYVCAASGALRVAAALLHRLPAGHNHAARVIARDVIVDRVLTPTQYVVDSATAVDASPIDRLGDRDKPMVLTNAPLAYVAMGIGHILGGLDHLAFVMALLLAATSWRALLLTISAFTVAHSITLAAAVTHALTLSPVFVEPAIALSIAWVGIENIAFEPGEKRRAAVAFIFGLLHGFGFSEALTARAISLEVLPWALLGFNVGVEIGQLAVIAGIVPVLRCLRRYPAVASRTSVVGSALIAAAGFAWFVVRISP